MDRFSATVVMSVRRRSRSGLVSYCRGIRSLFIYSDGRRLRRSLGFRVVSFRYRNLSFVSSAILIAPDVVVIVVVIVTALDDGKKSVFLVTLVRFAHACVFASAEIPVVANFSAAVVVFATVVASPIIGSTSLVGSLFVPVVWCVVVLEPVKFPVFSRGELVTPALLVGGHRRHYFIEFGRCCYCLQFLGDF